MAKYPILDQSCLEVAPPSSERYRLCYPHYTNVSSVVAGVAVPMPTLPAVSIKSAVLNVGAEPGAIPESYAIQNLSASLKRQYSKKSLHPQFRRFPSSHHIRHRS